LIFLFPEFCQGFCAAIPVLGDYALPGGNPCCISSYLIHCFVVTAEGTPPREFVHAAARLPPNSAGWISLKPGMSRQSNSQGR